MVSKMKQLKDLFKFINCQSYGLSLAMAEIWETDEIECFETKIIKIKGGYHD